MLAKCLLLEYRRAWFSELSFSRISESTTGYTHMWDILLSLTYTPVRRDHQHFSVSSERHRQCEVDEIA